MAQYRWENCPEAIQRQITAFTEAVKSQLAENLVGIYLHGSLAMGCFNPAASDIDLLIVTRLGMTPETKRDIVELLLRYSQAPSPIEISFLHEKELKPWQYPTPFDLHYSETWREQYQTDLAGGRWRQWNQKQNYDPDLAAHIILTNRRGICLWGEPIKAVFPSVPPKDYMASMLADIDWAKERVGQNPVYLILNLSRIYAYFRTGEIYSKDEGGVWVLNATPKAYHALVTAALEVYRGTGLDKSFDQKAVEQFVEYVEQEIKSLALR